MQLNANAVYSNNLKHIAVSNPQTSKNTTGGGSQLSLSNMKTSSDMTNEASDQKPGNLRNTQNVFYSQKLSSSKQS